MGGWEKGQVGRTGRSVWTQGGVGEEEGERGRRGIGGDWEGRGGLGTGKETLLGEKGDGDRGR